MRSYPYNMLLDNHNYGILKAESYNGFSPSLQKEFLQDNSSQVKWILSPLKMDRSVQGQPEMISEVKRPKSSGRGKHHKCIFKIFKKGQGSDSQEKMKRRKRRRGGKMKLGKKYLMPVILGILAAKSVLVPIALKALAFMSTKGLMMGFFSTVMASVLSLKGMFDTNHRYSDCKDEKTQVEVIQIPTPTKEDHYYSEIHDPYRRYDIVPVQPIKF